VGLRREDFIEESDQARSVRCELESGGYRVEFWALPPGAVLSGCLTESSGILYVDAGEAVLEIEGREMDLGAGDRVLLPAESIHTIRNGGAGPLAWLSAARRS
jgi:mannose-6-phosphate isomerase-like protein (cupin superfamily)